MRIQISRTAIENLTERQVLLPFICLIAIFHGGCAYSTRTIERCGVFSKTYRFIDPQFRDRVTFQVPQPWKISQPPGGGICGDSCFRNELNFGTILHFEAHGKTTVVSTDSQDSILADFRDDDIKNEKERITSYVKDITEIRNADPQLIFSRDLPNDIFVDVADIKKMGESKTKDGRVIYIWCMQSPTRGKRLHAWIPENGFVVTVSYYPSFIDELGQPNVDVMAQTIALYSNK